MPIPLTNGADLCGQRLRNLAAPAADTDATHRAHVATTAQNAAYNAAAGVVNGYDDLPDLTVLYESRLV